MPRGVRSLTTNLVRSLTTNLALSGCRRAPDGVTIRFRFARSAREARLEPMSVAAGTVRIMDISHVITAIVALLVGGVVAWALSRASFSAELSATRTRAQHAQRELDALEQEFDHRIEHLLNDRDRLTDAFEALSSRALERNSEVFLSHAEERLKRTQEANAAELAKREQAVKALVDPLTKSLAGVHEQMTAAERDRAEAHGALREQVKAMAQSSEALRGETSALVSALRASHVRGRWGELQLRRVVEVAGMVNHVDFTEQLTVESNGSQSRPDMVVHLPGSKQIVVDAKVSLSAFLDASETNDDGERRRQMVTHARHVREHVKSLADKSYWDQLPATPEFVVMFVPADSMLSAALEADPELLEHSFSQNVVVATPATLVALLRTVAYTWRQERLAEDAQKVFTTGRELHKRIGIFGRHFNDLGKRLNDAVTSFNRLNRSVDSTLVPQMKRFAELQALEDPFELHDPVEALAVAAEKPELFESEEVDT